MTSGNDSSEEEQFGLTEIPETLLQLEEEANTARDRGDYGEAWQLYNRAMRFTKRYLESIEETKTDTDLGPEQEEELEQEENQAVLYKDMLQDQIDRVELYNSMLEE